MGIKQFMSIALLAQLLFLASCSADQAHEQKAPDTVVPDQEVRVEKPAVSEREVAGFFFGTPVPTSNYYFVLRTVLTFGTPWGSVPNNTEELEERIWNDLLLSYEAHRRGITVERQELEAEIDKSLKDHKLSFDWKTDKAAYAKWVEETLKTSVEHFENQMQHLAQIRKLRQEIIDNAEVTVTEEQCRQKFFDEYHTLSVELARFDAKEEAEAFYQKAQDDPGFWEREVEKDNEIEDKLTRRFRRPGFVAADFLMHMWQFPRKAVYEMLHSEVGALYPPQPIYKGYGVFKVLEIRKADPSEFPKRRQYYEDRIRDHEKNRAFYYWRKDLYEKANVQIFLEPPEGIFQKTETNQ